MPNGICPTCRKKPIASKNTGYCHDCANKVNRARRLKRKEMFLSGQLKYPTAKQCKRCDAVKDARYFTVQHATRDGLSNWCKECVSAVCTKSNKRRKYGMDDSAIIAMLAYQGGGCPICLKPIVFGERKNNFHIDHDHETGHVRGILCEMCNPGLAKLGDDPARLAMGIEYLKRTLPLNHPSAADSKPVRRNTGRARPKRP